MVVSRRPNPETVEVLLDTAWRVAAAETARTDALDRKAAVLATFASLLTSLTVTFGSRFLEEIEGLGALIVLWLGLAALVGSVTLAVTALLPREYLTLGSTYLQRLPTWEEITKPPEDVRGETMRGVIRATTRERHANDGKARLVRRAFVALLVGLLLIVGDAAKLASQGILP